MIYFVQPVVGGPIKIGFSDDVPCRVRSLEEHYGQPLSLLATLDGDMGREREIHAQFSHLRYGRTEQFRPAADLLEFIGRPLLASANPDAVEAMPQGEQSFASLKGSEEYERWVDGLVEHAHQGTRTLLLKNALREFSENHGYGKVPPKR